MYMAERGESGSCRSCLIDPASSNDIDRAMATAGRIRCEFLCLLEIVSHVLLFRGRFVDRVRKPMSAVGTHIDVAHRRQVVADGSHLLGREDADMRFVLAFVHP